MLTDINKAVAKFDVAAAHGRENGRLPRSPIFFSLDIYSALSWRARASRARYIVTSIESRSLKVLAVDLDGFYGVVPLCVVHMPESDYPDFISFFFFTNNSGHWESLLLREFEKKYIQL